MADNKALADRLLGALPAPITNPEAWPPGYADGFNDCSRLAYEEAAAALTATPSAQAGEVVAWVPPAMLDPRVMGNFYTASRFAVTPESIPLVRATTPQPQGDASPGGGDASGHVEVLRWLEKALPEVGLNGWSRGVEAVRYAIAAMSTPQARPAKPEECRESCPPQQVCDHCQWPSGPDEPAPTVDGGNKWLSMQMFDHSPVPDDYRGQATGYRAGWNDALQTRPAPQADEYPEAAEVCAEAYQAVGIMLDDLGQFESERGTKLLDNLSQHRMVHKDVLPWPSLRPQADVALSDALGFLLTRIGSWSNARWDQHLRCEFGDARATKMIRALSPFTAAQQQGATNGQE